MTERSLHLSWLRWGLILAAYPIIHPLNAAEMCGVGEPCQVTGGFYRTSPPAAWDGKSALPTVLFFHGYKGSAAQEMADSGLRRAFSDLGILLVFPDSGPPGYWMYETHSKSARDEIGFTRTVLADVKRRWPVDDRLLWVAGFSDGGFMVWKLACHGRGEFRAYIAVSGAFVEPLPNKCESEPINLLEFHGLTDEMVQMEGSPSKEYSPKATSSRASRLCASWTAVGAILTTTRPAGRLPSGDGMRPARRGSGLRWLFIPADTRCWKVGSNWLGIGRRHCRRGRNSFSPTSARHPQLLSVP